MNILLDILIVFFVLSIIIFIKLFKEKPICHILSIILLLAGLTLSIIGIILVSPSMWRTLGLILTIIGLLLIILSIVIFYISGGLRND